MGFPIKSPDETITKESRTALQQLDYWKRVRLYWCEHTASVTINYNDNELEDIISWIYEDQGIVSGLSFLPNSDVKYQQMPFQTCTKEEYETALAALPMIDWSRIAEYESGDYTNASQELACVGGACDVDFSIPRI